MRLKPSRNRSIHRTMFVTCFSDGPSRMSPLDRLHAVAHAQAQAQAERRGPEHYSGVTSSDKPVALTTHLHGNHGKPEDLLHSPPTSIADFTGKALFISTDSYTNSTIHKANCRRLQRPFTALFTKPPTRRSPGWSDLRDLFLPAAPIHGLWEFQ